MLLHLIEETARRADMLRESIDGETAYLVAAAEGWPASDWIQPWQPPDVVVHRPSEAVS